MSPATDSKNTVTVYRCGRKALVMPIGPPYLPNDVLPASFTEEALVSAQAGEYLYPVKRPIDNKKTFMTLHMIRGGEGGNDFEFLCILCSGV